MTFRWPRFRRTNLSPVLEAGTLISVLVVTGGVLLFAELMEMVQGETRAFDRAMLLAFRNPLDLANPIGPRWLEIVFRDFTSPGGATVLTLMTIAVTGFLLIDGKARCGRIGARIRHGRSFAQWYLKARCRPATARS